MERRSGSWPGPTGGSCRCTATGCSDPSPTLRTPSRRRCWPPGKASAGSMTAFRRMNRRVSHLIAGWRTGLSRPVLILQAGNAINYFGYGLILPFEIIYLHQIRGFSTSIAGLVLAATQGTAAIAAPPTGALLDRYSAKAIVVAGSLASAFGYAGFAYVD